MPVIMRHFTVVFGFISQKTVEKKKVWFVKIWEPRPCGVELSSSCRAIECVHSRPFDMSQQESRRCIDDSGAAPLWRAAAVCVVANYSYTWQKSGNVTVIISIVDFFFPAVTSPDMWHAGNRAQSEILVQEKKMHHPLIWFQFGKVM